MSDIPVPKGETEFTRDNESKNFTKLVIDDEHNKAFIEEMQEAIKEGHEDEGNFPKEVSNQTISIDFGSSTQDVASTTTNIESTTQDVISSSIDVSSSTQDVASTTITNNEESVNFMQTVGTPVPEATVVDTEGNKVVIPAHVIGESTPIEAEVINEPEAKENEFENKTLEKEIESVLHIYEEDPAKLKFNKDEIEELVRAGVIDRDTIEFIIDEFNTNVDDLIKNKTLDPSDENYLNEEEYNKQLKLLIENKIDTEKIIKACKDLRDPAFIEELFNARFPWYKLTGSGYVLLRFNEYLNNRRSNENEEQRLLFEINSNKKVQKILDNCEKKIFSKVKLSNGQKFTLGAIFTYVFKWNIANIAKVLNRPEEEIEKNIKDPDVSGIVGITSVLLLRYLYNTIMKNIERSKLDQFMFIKFVCDNIGVENIDDEKKSVIKENWEKIIINTFELYEKSKTFISKKH